MKIKGEKEEKRIKNKGIRTDKNRRYQSLIRVRRDINLSSKKERMKERRE